MTLAQTNQTTDRDDWWDQVTDAYVDETPFKGGFSDGEGTLTSTAGTTEEGDDQ
ncbi:MAG: hypothetical protein PHE17_07520 [Thiothrix sp.]|jgi:hypothetical protein|uniref:hypothetical protein n=1 Tax=Thiothrix sp. TaxID=1032 RepID=UPI00262C911B|nr:hypothetical protein [Thiothrix sp.]MDD5392854.1 hypothetical protein [Thiothrix sp.]